VLVADDDAVSLTVVAAMLRKAGFAVTLVGDGDAAWAALSGDSAPTLALLDWEMPGLDGPEIVRRIRANATSTPTYVILLTARGATVDIVAGLKAGANDYVTKPANQEELLARVGVGARVVELQQALSDRVRSLEEALANVRTLQGLLPICSYCKAIRNDQNYWERVETYFSDHSGVQFSHSYCPICYERFVKPQLDALDDLGPPRRR
jgi:DNA-binding response OmpR family regulator